MSAEPRRGVRGGGGILECSLRRREGGGGEWPRNSRLLAQPLWPGPRAFPAVPRVGFVLLGPWTLLHLGGGGRSFYVRG